MSQPNAQEILKITYRVTNHSGIPVVVLQGSVKTADELSTQLYDQDLTLLTAGNANGILEDGNSGSVGFDNAEPDTDYTLIIARADNLFPVKVVPVVWPGDGTTSIALEATANDRKNMVLAEKFLQAITAMPTSDLAQSYNSALGNDDLGSTKRFFDNTTSYKTVSTDKVLAVQTYYNAFPYIWANYSAEKTYTLNSSDGTTITTVGTLKITSPQGPIAKVNKTNTDFTIEFNPAGTGAASKINYADGKFQSADGQETVSLQGFFDVESSSVNDPSAQVIVSRLRGTVGGVEVLGSDQSQTTGDSQPWISLGGLLHPQTLKDKLQLTGIVVGIAALLVAVMAAVTGTVFGVIRMKARRATAFDPSEENGSDEEEIILTPEEEDARNFMKADMEAQLVSPLDKWLIARKSYASYLDVQRVQAMRDIITQQEDLIQSLTKEYATTDLEEALDAVMDTRQQLIKALYDKDERAISKVEASINKNTATLQKMQLHEEYAFTQTQKASLERVSYETVEFESESDSEGSGSGTETEIDEFGNIIYVTGD